MQFLLLSSTALSCKISLKGAELISVQRPNGDENMWSADPAFWNRTAPHLFPIVGRLKQDQFVYDGQHYTLTQHGFARDCMFEVEHHSDTAVTFLLHASEETKKFYPFDFEFRVHYTLENATLTISYDTKNTGQNSMPYSVGGHPAFALDHPLEEYALVFEQELEQERWLLDGGHFTGQTRTMHIKQKLALSESLFEDDAVVFKDPKFQQVSLVHQTAGKLVTVRSSNWEAIGFWKKAQAPFLCIEPWWGYADYTDSNGDLFHKKGIHVLKSGQQEKFSYTMEF
jgi:galactose mutarotase-like enzyme